MSEKKPVREPIEWCRIWRPGVHNTESPRVLLIGDSICEGYGPIVDQKLEGKAVVDRLATSKCVSDPMFFREVQLTAEEYDYAVVHFNTGLHGHHQTEAEYGAGLRTLVDLLRGLAPDATLIWASSTPVTEYGDTSTFSEEKNPHVVMCNEVAAAIMAEEGIVTNDLYALVDGRTELRVDDGYHYNSDGGAVLADAVLEVVQRALDA
jgi:hypothetical protein